jgi:hypothetical protein
MAYACHLGGDRTHDLPNQSFASPQRPVLVGLHLFRVIASKRGRVQHLHGASLACPGHSVVKVLLANVKNVYPYGQKTGIT